MLNRRKMLKKVMMAGAGAAGATLMGPMVARAAGECDAFGNCVVGIPTNVFNMVDAKQRSSKWCWAASAEMILNYWSIPITQEEIVYRIKGGFSDEAANYHEIVDSLNGVATNTAGGTSLVSTQTVGVTIENMLTDLYEDRPLLLAYDTGAGGHAVVLTAVNFRMIETYHGEDVELVSVTVRDPWPDRPSKSIWNADELAARTNFMARVYVDHA